MPARQGGRGLPTQPIRYGAGCEPNAGVDPFDSAYPEFDIWRRHSRRAVGLAVRQHVATPETVVTFPEISSIDRVTASPGPLHVCLQLGDRGDRLPGGTREAVSRLPAHATGERCPGPATHARCNSAQGIPRTGGQRLTSVFPPLPRHGRATPRRAAARILSMLPVQNSEGPVRVELRRPGLSCLAAG